MRYLRCAYNKTLPAVISRESYKYNFTLEHPDLKLNQPTRCRVNIEGVHYGNIIMSSSAGPINHLTNDDLYDYVITPRQKGEERIRILLFDMETEKMITVAELVYNVE